MTARFHKSWADFGGLKPYAALEYETSQMIAHGAKCSIGDQMHPRGTLDAGAYELIGRVYKRIADREPWLAGTTPLTDIGLFQIPTGNAGNVTEGADEGATRMLTQLRQQFDVVDAECNLSRYPLLILPDAVAVDTAMAEEWRVSTSRSGVIHFAAGVSRICALALAMRAAAGPVGSSAAASSSHCSAWRWSPLL